MTQTEIDFYTKIVSDGYTLPPTSGVPPETLADLQASAVRSWVTGKMKLNPIRKDVHSMTLTWSEIPIQTMLDILSHTKSKEDGGTNVEVYDPIQNKRVVKRMYRSDRKYSKMPYTLGMYANLEFDFIEM